MKLGLVTKIDNNNTTTSKLNGDDIALGNYDVIIIFSTDGRFGATRNPESGHMVYISYIFINKNLLSYKN